MGGMEAPNLKLTLFQEIVPEEIQKAIIHAIFQDCIVLNNNIV